MRNLYLVSTPLQVLNALEAKAAFPAEEHILLVKHLDSPLNIHLTERLVRKEDWSEIHRVKRKPLRLHILTQYFVFSRLLRRKKFDRAFWGNYFSNDMRFMVAGLSPENIFLLDDGASTIWVQSTLMPGNKPVSMNSGDTRLKKIVAGKLFGLKTDLPPEPPVGLFTLFDLKPWPGQNIVRNTFGVLKSKIPVQASRDDSKVYFIGTAFYEYKCLSWNESMEMMRRVSAYYNQKGLKMIYLPHRRETQEKLSAFREILGIEHERPEDILELHFINRRIIPAHVASFYSTALTTIPMIYPGCTADAFLPDLSRIRMIPRERLERSYAYQRPYTNLIDISK